MTSFRRYAIGICFFLLAVFMAADNPVAPSATASDPSRSCEAKINSIRQGQASGTVQFSENEINAYLSANLNRFGTSSPREMTVKFKKDLALITAVVNLEDAKIKFESLLEKAFAWILAGTHRLQMEIKLTAKDGRGIYDFESFHVDGLPVPVFVIRTVASQLASRQKTVILPAEPFQLPFNLKSCQLSWQHALCETGDGNPSKR